MVIDVRTLVVIRGELVRWGYHYNQAVHALNSVALYVRRAGSKTEYYVEQLERANVKLAKVDSGHREVSERLERLEHAIVICG